MEVLDIQVRPASATDAAGVAEVWVRSFDAALPSVRRAHTDDEVRAWFRDVVVPRGDAWVAVVDGRIVGMVVVHGDELDQLYVDPAWSGRGIGARLVALAKELSPTCLALWTFQVNVAARRFYERHGFVEVERTDGSGNEEREPDVRYVWSGRPTGRTSARPALRRFRFYGASDSRPSSNLGLRGRGVRHSVTSHTARST